MEEELSKFPVKQKEKGKKTKKTTTKYIKTAMEIAKTQTPKDMKAKE